MKNYSLSTILEKEEELPLKNSGNTHLGGETADVTDEVAPFNRFICERISRMLKLDVAGIDIISEDIRKPLTENNAKVIEVNAAPDFRIHINPTRGTRREVQEKFMEMLFPDGTKTRVPLISVTGSHGKTLFVKLLSYCLRQNGWECGVVSSEGLFISDHFITAVNITDSPYAEMVLKDPGIDCAIIETPVESILNFGLGYKYADAGIILNLDENKEEYYHFDHIRDIIDIAYAKAVVAEEVYSDGIAVLNADYELLLKMCERLYCKYILFSKNPENPAIRQHTEKGGTAVLLDGESIKILAGREEKPFGEIQNITFLCNVSDNFITDSVLAVISLLHAWGKTEKEIYYLLRDFSNE
jgi:cyanophycin synthetase